MSFSTNVTPDATPAWLPIPAWDNNTDVVGGPDTASLNVIPQRIATLFAYLGTSAGANQIGCNAADSAPVAGSLQEQIVYLNGYARLIRGNSVNQVTLAYDASGNLTLGLPQDIATNSSPTFSTVNATTFNGYRAIFQHLVGTNPGGVTPTATPTITAWGAGAGTTAPTDATPLTGNDILMTLTFTATTTPASSSVIANISFAAPFTNTPIVLPFPGNAQGRAALQTGSGLTAAAVSATSQTGFTFSSVAALTAGNVYSFRFLVISYQ